MALTIKPDGSLDGPMFHLLSTEYSLDDVLDLLELDDIGRSWHVAAQLNAKERRE